MICVKKPFEYLDHPADVGFAARGGTLAECFEAAADALADFGWEIGAVEPREPVPVRLREATLEDLLFSWLSEILYLTDAEQWVFRRFEVKRIAGEESTAETPFDSASAYAEATADRQDRQRAQRKKEEESEPFWELEATAWGEKFDETRHKPRTYIKAATYHQLSVAKTPGGWEATVYIDV